MKVEAHVFLFKDITSLLHTIYEVVDASVNHSPSSSKTLRVKLSVTPDASQRWRNNSSTHANTGTGTLLLFLCVCVRERDWMMEVRGLKDRVCVYELFICTVHLSNGL